MRTIPVGRSIAPHLEVLPYEQVGELVQAQDRFAVAPCVCRRKARMLGGGCAAPEESCLVFGNWADAYVQEGRGRRIDRAEVLRGLQQQPTPSEAVASSFIASLEPGTCEGCWVCLERCQMQALAEDGDRVRLNTDRCIGCGLCVSTCPTGALTLTRKPASMQAQPPVTLTDTWRTIRSRQIAQH
jgi:Na+-translocating ferredoxin:NAD+ oxidoreductase subunit B